MEGWGGATYSLSALDAALGDDWTIVPIVKVGRDRAHEARVFLDALRRIDHSSQLVVDPPGHLAAGRASQLLVVDEPNNCSELHYVTEETRTEKLSGGVPAWRWEELRDALTRTPCDALYVNFLSGWEIDIETAKALRAWFNGPIYADIHMMVWKPAADGRRVLTPVDRADEWFACFDILQVNEDEMKMLAGSAESFGARAAAQGARCSVVTLGKAGVHWFAESSFETTLLGSRAANRRGALESGVVAATHVREGPGTDPTGCGDVWGATFLARLLDSDGLQPAIAAANIAASRNAGYHGVAGLAAYLRRRT